VTKDEVLTALAVVQATVKNGDFAKNVVNGQEAAVWYSCELNCQDIADVLWTTGHQHHDNVWLVRNGQSFGEALVAYERSPDYGQRAPV
jgi:hypothetical protein